MNTLLESAIEARGGRARWREVKALTAHVSVGGGTLALKGWPDALDDARFSIDPHRQRTEIHPLGEPGQRGVFEPGRTTILGADGQAAASRDQPRQAFAGHSSRRPGTRSTSSTSRAMRCGPT
jgi:hypothetical protein